MHFFLALILSALEYTSRVSEWVSEAAQSCLTLCDPVDLPGSSIHGILQARILEWVAISFSRGSSRPRDRTQVTAGRCFNLWATREAHQLQRIFFDEIGNVQLMTPSFVLLPTFYISLYYHMLSQLFISSASPTEDKNNDILLYSQNQPNRVPIIYRRHSVQYNTFDLWYNTIYLIYIFWSLKVKS